MGFSDAKRQVLTCLKSRKILHEERNNIEIKNLLSTGQVSVEEVKDILSQVRGNEYEGSKHHTISTLDVHIVKTSFRGKHWYIKWYYLEPDSIFISVHL